MVGVTHHAINFEYNSTKKPSKLHLKAFYFCGPQTTNFELV